MIVFRNNEQYKQNILEFCLKNKDRNWENLLITDEVSFYLWSPGKKDGLQQVILIKEQRQNIQIKFMHGEHLVLKELLNFNFLQEIWIVSSISKCCR